MTVLNEEQSADFIISAYQSPNVRTTVSGPFVLPRIKGVDCTSMRSIQRPE